ncbi:chaperonin [Gracilibacillus boraciitolerans JCM 21714]|uniref:33 kDa chaperonin n=1 Tax=Gracilibacillus boraciitolerans JCM 21714 TaxID=1298598 RepID=W4VMZ7_9BACI|nr:Hsp33 family molecular chaperone HslO [Gracilibacillus boraciitolerans]GAE94218.1 chaperonin [Gracilibacillus boraciitolerans JCM 21714]
MDDYLLKATGYNGGDVRAYAIRTTNTVEEARKRQDTWATASAALGRTITITTMLGAMLKGEDKLTVKVEGNGPMGAIIADANAKGQVRGYCINSHVDFETNEQGKLDVKRAVGTEGTLSIVKDLGLKTNFTGQVPIISGEISEDFTYYLANSEQVPSAVGAGVLVNPDHSILAAGGFIVQMMPDASEDTITKIEASIAEIPPISTMIQHGKTPEEILDAIIGADHLKIHEKSPVEFSCPCSKERLETAIQGLGNEEIDAMIREDHGATASCHFCNETYSFTINELKALKTH